MKFMLERENKAAYIEKSLYESEQDNFWQYLCLLGFSGSNIKNHLEVGGSNGTYWQFFFLLKMSVFERQNNLGENRKGQEGRE